MSKFINIHMIQSVPINSLNRDDLGNVKTVRFGGSIRQRVSSQCWKRQIRAELEKSTDVSWRSSFFPQKLYNRLIKGGLGAKDALEKIGAVFSGSKEKDRGKMIEDWKNIEKNGSPIAGEPLKTSYLIFISEKEFERITEECTNDNPKSIKGILKDGKDRYGASIALFGRMLADHPDLNVDAASLFAHAFTTHEIAQEADYFTAMDDLKTDPGAGHLNQGSYTTGTFYRHIAIDVDTLKNNLSTTEGNIPELMGAFVEACYRAFPIGKKNSFLSNTLPSKMIVDITSSMPLSMANAFEEPVVSSEGYIRKSIEALKTHRELLMEEGYGVSTSIESSSEISIDSIVKFVKENCA